MQPETFRIPADIPPALRSLIEEFGSDAFRIRNLSAENVNAQIIYIARFFRHFGPPGSCKELFGAVSPGSISMLLVEYAARNTPSSLRWMQVSLRSFLRFAFRSSLIGRELSALVPVRSNRRLGTVPRSLPDECIARLRSGIDRSSVEGMRDAAIICLLAIYGVQGVQIRRLRLDGIDWRGDRIHFPAAKGGRPIDQHLMPEAGNLLSGYIRSARPSSEHSEIFLTLHEPFCPLPNATYLSNTVKPNFLA